ncbi:MAG: hypothetical protein HY855_06890 [Burkholderiales bacterium]|nr:hypothetical protein [Burkholderiales bacterium]
MPSSNPLVIEPYARHLGNGAMLFINADASWSVGSSSKSLVKVKVGAITSITDDTFGHSAVAVESDGKGGWRLFVRSDVQNDSIIEVLVAANGEIAASSVKALTQAELYAAENQYKIDLNDNGGFGAESVLIEGGAVNLYVDAVGAYQVGTSSTTIVTLRAGGVAITDEVLPAGWELAEVQPATGGYTVYAMDPSGAIFAASFNAAGELTGGGVLSAAQLEALETGGGLDIDSDFDLPLTPNWTSTLKDTTLRQLIEAAMAPAAQSVGPNAGADKTTQNTGTTGMTYTELVNALNNVIASHKAAGNTPISADEVASLQALAARGKAAFTGPTAAAGDYLAYVFGKMVDSSDANRFFNGGSTQRSELGGLTAGTSIENFEKLVSKWLLGGDLPSPATGGDTANARASSVTAVYAKSSGSLFVDGVALADVAQGSAGDCYLIAVMAAVAGTTPTAIEAMVVENATVDGNRSWGVRFFDANGKAHWVTVNDMLPTSPDNNARLAYAGSAAKDLNGEIWVPLIEKAYAQANALGILPRAEARGLNSYGGIEGGHGDPYTQLLAGKVAMYSVVANAGEAGTAPLAGNEYITWNGIDGSSAQAKADFIALLKGVINGGSTVWVGVRTTQADSFGNQLLVGGHAHYLVDADTTDPSNSSVLAYNPWGLQAAPNPPAAVEANYLSPVPYTLEQLVELAGLSFCVMQAAQGG